MKKIILITLILALFTAGETKENDSVMKYVENGFTYQYNREGHYFEMYSPNNIKIANIFFFDNGPDYYSEGLRRIVEDNKIGFIDKKNRIVIEPQFDFAKPFQDGFALVVKDPVFKKTGEHTVISGGKWGLVNRKGILVVPMEYDDIIDYSKREAVVMLKNKKVHIKIR